MKQLLTIRPVLDKKSLKQFIDYPHDLYKEDPHYVPELFLSQKALLWPGEHPFYDHSRTQLFLAFKGDRIVGRIAGVFNANHIQFTGEKDGFFGFFDCENDQEVANALFGAVRDWLEPMKLNQLIGPINLTTNDTCGLLVEGYDDQPYVMMPYNKAYYAALILKSGFVKKTDLIAYKIETALVNDKVITLLDRLESRLSTKGIRIRPVNVKDFKNEIIKVREVYNKAWDKNLGFVPMTEAEFEHAAKDMKMILDPKFCLVAEKDGVFIGFILGLPNINEILAKISRGRLLPTGIFKLLLNKNKIRSVRVLMLGVLEDYRKLGIEACLYGKIIQRAREKGIKEAECSWMLEDNYLMNHAIEQLNGEFYKRYRIYESQL